MQMNPRSYPETMISAESGRLMTRGEKEVTLNDLDDMEGQLVDGDNQIAEMARRTAKAMAEGESVFVPVVIRAIRQVCGKRADMCGGRSVMCVLTASRNSKRPVNYAALLR